MATLGRSSYVLPGCICNPHISLCSHRLRTEGLGWGFELWPEHRGGGDLTRWGAGGPEWPRQRPQSGTELRWLPG